MGLFASVTKMKRVYYVALHSWLCCLEPLKMTGQERVGNSKDYVSLEDPSNIDSRSFHTSERVVSQ